MCNHKIILKNKIAELFYLRISTLYIIGYSTDSHQDSTDDLTIQKGRIMLICVTLTQKQPFQHVFNAE